MATEQSTVDYIIEQMAGAGVISARKMFGDYGFYCDGKIIGLICDDQLFVKPTDGGRDFIGEPTEAPAYPGAKNSFLIDAEKWDDADWMAELIQISYRELPEPKPKKKKKT